MSAPARSKKEITAIDALTKIAAMLSTAQLLTSTKEESELMLELVGVAEDVALRALDEVGA